MSTDLLSSLASLPHGKEFRFIDQLESLTPGQEAIGIYRLPPEANFLAGHFPGDPIMPGVLMVESLAQLAGIAAQTCPNSPPLTDLRLTAIKHTKIYGTIEPGQCLRIQATISGRLGSLVQATGSVSTSDGTRLLEGQVTLSGSLPEITTPSTQT